MSEGGRGVLERVGVVYEDECGFLERVWSFMMGVVLRFVCVYV